MKIAMIGTRGVPAKYGGFETCVEEVGRRLAAKGHQVTVYCRSGYYQERPQCHQGMTLCYRPNLARKSLDTLSHTLFSALDAARQDYDIYMVFNAANAAVVSLLRLLGKNIIINTDGLEWKRSKWGPAGRTYYKFSEKASCFVANRLVSDSYRMQEYYREAHGTDSTRIAYGAYVQDCHLPERLTAMGLEPFQYFLQITRFEPENNPLMTIEAFRKAKTGKKLVLVGGNPYPSPYLEQILAAKSEDIILPGFIYDPDILRELWCCCLAYVHGNEVGGTNPALLQTMASGCFAIAVDVPFNREVLADCGIYFQKNADSLASALEWAAAHEDDLPPYRRLAVERIKAEYSWDQVADLYEQLFQDVLEGKYRWRPKIPYRRPALRGQDSF